MTRDLSAANAAAARADAVAPVIFLDLAFDEETLRLHTWLGDIAWGGNTYTGVGTLAGVSAVQEESDLARTPVALTLSGIPGDLVSVVLNEHYQGRTAAVYLGYLDPETLQLEDDPAVLYRGRMDTAAVEQGAELTVTISVESRFAAWDKPKSRRYNDADQQARFPGDRGMQYVEQSTEKLIAWGTQLKA